MRHFAPSLPMVTPQSAEFVALWSEHSRAIYAYICSLVFNSSDADDIFQETSLTLFEKFAEFDSELKFAPWAYGVAHNKVLQFLARRRLLDHVDAQLLEAIEEGARGASVLAESRFAALAECVAKLSAKDHKVIRLRYQRGATVKAVADKVGRSAAMVYKSLARIHDSLLECVRQRLREGDGS